MTAFIRLFKEELNDTVANLREFCDSGENVERLINKLVPRPPPGSRDPPRNIRGLGISRVQNHRRYVLDLASARGILTQAEQNDLGINCMDSHSTKPTGLLRLLEAVTKKAGIRMEGYLPGATPSRPSPAPTPLPSYSRETGPAPAPALSVSRSSPAIPSVTPSYSRDTGPAPPPTPSYSRDTGPAPPPTPSYSRDTGPAPPPTPSYSRDTGPAPPPTPSYSRDTGPAPAPTPSYSRDSGPAPPPTPSYSRDAAPPRVSLSASFGGASPGASSTPRWSLVQKRSAVENDRKNKVRRLETSLAVYQKSITDLARLLRIVAGDATPETVERVQSDFLQIAGPGDEASNPAVLLYREIVDKIDPELADLLAQTGQGSTAPEPVGNPADLFREIARLQGEIRARLSGSVTPLQIAINSVPPKLDELRQSIAAVESSPNTRKQAIERAHAQLLRLIQLIRVDLPRSHSLSKFPQDRAAFNRRELEDALNPLQIEVEALVKNEERIAQLQGDYQWDCISIDKDIPLAEGICGNRPKTPTYASAMECIRRLEEVKAAILAAFESAKRTWAELERMSAGREIQVSTERYRPEPLADRVDQVKQELETAIAELGAFVETVRQEQTDE